MALPPALRPTGEAEATSRLDRLVKLYGPVIVHVPWLWGWAFRAADNGLSLRAYLALLARRVQARIEEVLQQTDAAAIVSVHPLVNHPMVRARARLGRDDLALMTILTDLVDIHRWWAAPRIEQYVASSEVAAERLVEFGVSPSRIATLGIPLRPEFSRMAYSAREMRAKLDLDLDLPLLLLMGGGEGAGRLPDVARSLASNAAHGVRFQMVVVTGRNARAREALEQEPWPLPVRVLGFVSNIVEYMTAADLIVTKPGSLTLSEALVLGRPLLLGRPVPGQEEGNVAYVVNAGAGLAYRTPEEAMQAARYLLTDAPARWEMSLQAARLGHPQSAERTMDLLQALLLRAERATPRPPTP